MYFLKSYSICLVIKKSILSLLEFLNLFLLQVLDNKGYNAWFLYSQGHFCIIIDTKKLQCKDNFPCGFQLFICACSFKRFIFICSSLPFFGYLLIYVYTLTFSSIISSFIQISILIVSNYNIFICKGLFHWQFSQEYFQSQSTRFSNKLC